MRRGGLFGWFNRGFTAGREAYGAASRGSCASGRLLVYLCAADRRLAGCSAHAIVFLPIEDQGYMITNVQIAAGRERNRTAT